MKRRLLSFVLAFAMLLSVTPVAVFATDTVVAKIGDTEYGTLSAALNAAADGATIELIWAEGDAPISMAGSVFGNKTVTITGTATVDWSKGWLFVGRGGEGDGKLIFRNANLTAYANSGRDIGIHVSGHEKGEAAKNNGTVEMINSKIELDYLINKGTMVVDNTVLFVHAGFGIAGRPASETEDGKDATATITIKNGSNVTVKNENGMGMGYEGNGVLNLENSSFTCNSPMNVYKEDGSAFNVSGECTLNIESVNGQSLNLLDGAILKNSTVGGELFANGDITFSGVNKVTTFNPGWYNHVITIGPGASLEITGGGRMTLGYGNIFNITGSIVDAKTADLNTVVPSLKVPAGISITGGNGAALNVKNAYIEAGLTSSKPGAANGKFDINLTNSVAVFKGKFALDTSTGGMTPVFNTSLKNSVLNVAGHLVFGNTGCNTTIDNSVVKANSSFRNDGSLNLTNGSVLNVAAMIQAGENAGNSGTIVVDGSKLHIDCSTAGHAMDGKGTGKLVVVNGGAADVGYITDTDVEADLTSSLTSEALLGDITVTIDASNFNGTSASVLNLGTKLDENVVKITGTGAADVEVTDDGKVKVVVNTPDKAFDGKGTKDDPYLINGLDDLLAFRILVNNGNDFAGKTVKLTADIDMSDVDNWLPIGLNNHNQKDYAHKSFNGTFDGNNKTISNLTLVDVFFNDGYAGDGHYSTGLFGFASGATIKDLTLANVSGHLDWWSGCVVGKGGHPLTLTNVHVTGADMTGYGTYIGGLVGHCYNAKMTDCSFSGTINVPGSAQVGGLLGSGNPNADGCTVNATIVAGEAVGGVVGNAQESTVVENTKVNVSMSVASGAGGIIGYGNSVSYVSGNYIEGTLQANGELADFSIAGVVGYANNGTLGINNNYINAYVKDANGNLVDRPVVGVYNVAVTETTDVSMFDENSWNREIYDFEDLPIYENDPDTGSASGNVFVDRNNNLVMLESDLAYIDAENADDVTIMQFSDVTEDEVAHAVIVNKSVASITDSNGVTTYYDTLAEAMAVVGAGNVVIELTDDATLSYPARSAFGAADTTSITINGNGHTLTLHQTDTDWSSIGMANANGKLVLNNMTINKTSAGGNNAWNNHAINFHCDVEMNNVTVNNSVAVHADAVLNNVDIVENGEYYGLWITADGQTVTMNGGSITATNGGRGIKIADQYVDAVESVTLNVTGTTFTTAKKAAILVTSTEGAAITVSNIDISGVAQDKIHAVWMDEDRGEHFDKVTVVGGNVLQEGEFACIVIKNDAILGYYKTLEAAFADASDDDTVVLLDNVNAAVTYAVDKTLTLDLNGYTIESDADEVLTASAGELTIVDNSADKTGAIVSDDKTAIHSSAYVAIKSGKFDGAITTKNAQIDDSQVCITGGTFTQKPDADLVEHSYTVLTNEDDTYTVVDTEYTLTIINAGANASGAGIYIYRDVVTVYAGEMNGYFFGEWGSEDVDVTGFTSDTVTFVMPDHDVTLTVYWSTTGPANPGTPVVLPGTLNFETNGGTPIDSISRVAGTKVDLSQFVTVREGYTFAGWYSDAALTKPVTVITLRSTKTVYAGWIENAVTPDIPVVIMPFTDVNAGDYYYNAVLWAAATGITNGTTATTFGPDAVCTRAQVVTFLWRAAGCPIAKTNDMPFTDVSRDMYYYDAVQWAVEQGITNGISDTEFGPDAECSRAQIVTFLWRSQGSPAAAADGGFHDVAADAYYATAVEWAVDNGVTNGMGDNAFAPDAECTRAQTVTFLYRHFCK